MKNQSQPKTLFTTKRTIQSARNGKHEEKAPKPKDYDDLQKAKFSEKIRLYILSSGLPLIGTGKQRSAISFFRSQGYEISIKELIHFYKNLEESVFPKDTQLIDKVNIISHSLLNRIQLQLITNKLPITTLPSIVKALTSSFKDTTTIKVLESKDAPDLFDLDKSKELIDL